MEPRVAVFWSSLPGYLDACLHELEQNASVRLYLSGHDERDAPYDQTRFSAAASRESTSAADAGSLTEDLRAAAPDVCLVGSWDTDIFLQAMSAVRPRSLRVLCMDNQWRGGPRQRAGQLYGRFKLQRCFDAAFVPGERQAVFAGKLGFPPGRIWRGLYACDWNRFNQAREASPMSTRKGGFVYAGRFAPEKGLEVLADAFNAYTATEPHPWPLTLVGAGELPHSLRRNGLVARLPFAQPEELPGILSDHRAFVLPSTFEPWGVALQEAAVSGLPLVATTASGAAVHLLADGYNGRLVPPGNAAALRRAMASISRMNATELMEAGAASAGLGRQFTPRIWARTVLQGSPRGETAVD